MSTTMCELVRPVARHVVERVDSPIWNQLVAEYGIPGTGECAIPFSHEGEIVENKKGNHADA